MFKIKEKNIKLANIEPSLHFYDMIFWWKKVFEEEWHGCHSKKLFSSVSVLGSHHLSLNNDFSWICRKRDRPDLWIEPAKKPEVAKKPDVVPEIIDLEEIESPAKKIRTEPK